ncbi:hypothetical protein ECG_02783 [Echinococcus granulosus]|uniref:Expressed protein n=1 Tax=Echinococcus granulosus TaxID=6210 RepID=A0A068WRI9_ECHGR|nr:hypothetical protein ECG_02783 [Echinococcus granulosus]CDS20256.1 expressed protein [Echinococcus granulosus]
MLRHTWRESSQSSWTSARGVTMYSINIKNNHVCTALTAVEANQRAHITYRDRENEVFAKLSQDARGTSKHRSQEWSRTYETGMVSE